MRQNKLERKKFFIIFVDAEEKKNIEIGIEI